MSFLSTRRFSYHNKQIKTLQEQYNRLQNRIHQIYIDKLDAKIDEEFYEEKVDEWREEMEDVKATMEEHENADSNYLSQGVHILELAQKAYSLYIKQQPGEKRKLLNFLLSNCTIIDLSVHPTYRKPFDLLAKGVEIDKWRG